MSHQYFPQLIAPNADAPGGYSFHFHLVTPVFCGNSEQFGRRCSRRLAFLLDVQNDQGPDVGSMKSRLLPASHQ